MIKKRASFMMAEDENLVADATPIASGSTGQPNDGFRMMEDVRSTGPPRAELRQDQKILDVNDWLTGEAAPNNYGGMELETVFTRDPERDLFEADDAEARMFPTGSRHSGDRGVLLTCLILQALPALPPPGELDVVLAGQETDGTPNGNIEDEAADGLDEDDNPVNSFVATEYLPWMYFRKAGPSDLVCPFSTDDDPHGPPFFRCRDCVACSVCQACLLRLHKHNPFHMVEEWKDHPRYETASSFQRTSLFDAGLCLNLEHSGASCPSIAALFTLPSTLTVTHVNGIHRVVVQYCSCQDAPPPYAQLLRNGIFPATSKRPANGFTFPLLQMFQRLNLVAHVSLYHFFAVLRHSTNNVNFESTRVSMLSTPSFNQVDDPPLELL